MAGSLSSWLTVTTSSRMSTSRTLGRKPAGVGGSIAKVSEGTGSRLLQCMPLHASKEPILGSACHLCYVGPLTCAHALDEVGGVDLGVAVGDHWGLGGLHGNDLHRRGVGAGSAVAGVRSGWLMAAAGLVQSQCTGSAPRCSSGSGYVGHKVAP